LIEIQLRFAEHLDNLKKGSVVEPLIGTELRIEKRETLVLRKPLAAAARAKMMQTALKKSIPRRIAPRPTETAIIQESIEPRPTPTLLRARTNILKSIPPRPIETECVQMFPATAPPPPARNMKLTTIIQVPETTFEVLEEENDEPSLLEEIGDSATAQLTGYENLNECKLCGSNSFLGLTNDYESYEK